MFAKKRKGAETRRDAVRRQFREAAERANPSPYVVVLDSRGRPRRKPRQALQMKA